MSSAPSLREWMGSKVHGTGLGDDLLTPYWEYVLVEPYIRKRANIRCSFSISRFTKRTTRRERMAERKSKRLRQEPPEIEQLTYECFICRGTSQTCDIKTLRLRCCGNFVHRQCQTKREEHKECAACGAAPKHTSGVDKVPTLDEITTLAMGTSREEVVRRLKSLEGSEELETLLREVRHFSMKRSV